MLPIKEYCAGERVKKQRKLILRTTRTCLETEWKVVSLHFVFPSLQPNRTQPQLDHIVSYRYQFHLLTFEVTSYAHFPFSWILGWLFPNCLQLRTTYFSLFISLARTTNEMPKILKNARETKKPKTKNQKNQNEIRPEANVNKVQGDVCFCQKKKKNGKEESQKHWILWSVRTPHCRVLSAACPA